MKFLRKWSTPWTIGAFLLMSATGVLMFFHWNSGVNKLAHQWLSWAFLLGVFTHVITNWLAFSRYFKSPLALGVMAVFAVVLGLSFLPLTAPRAEPPTRAVFATLNRTPLSELAPLLHTTPDALVAKVRAKGYAVDGADQTPEQIAVDKKKAPQVLGVIFARDGDKPRGSASKFPVRRFEKTRISG